MGSSSRRSRSRSAQSPLHQTPSSSVDSNCSSDPPPCLNNFTANDNHERGKPSYLDTNLSLGLGGNHHIPRIELFGWEKRHDWSPIKPLPRSGIAGRFFIKVYMEGVLIGRKLDLLAHNDYDDLVKSLARMFDTNIQRPGESAAPNLPDKLNVLTYEDKDGDWMMVGDVPWEMFKCTVKRMMIARPDNCQGDIKFT